MKLAVLWRVLCDRFLSTEIAFNSAAGGKTHVSLCSMFERGHRDRNRGDLQRRVCSAADPSADPPAAAADGSSHLRSYASGLSRLERLGGTGLSAVADGTAAQEPGVATDEPQSASRVLALAPRPSVSSTWSRGVSMLKK